MRAGYGPAGTGTWVGVGAMHPGDAAAVCVGASVNYFGTTAAVIVRSQEFGPDGAVVSVHERQCLPYHSIASWGCYEQTVLGPTGVEAGHVGEGPTLACEQTVWVAGMYENLTGHC
ncbi:MAG: hypothetical protein HY775_12155 [Acidobacteria bacterium]|nr:hypothetical protein [Acidobacteriota bacterium]